MRRAGRSQPSVTVVVPSYENNDTLPAALRSLEAQTIAHTTIIVDDGSSVPVAESVCTGDAVVLRQENRGVGAARNLGIEQAAGEIIAFLDADDVWDATYLERQLHYLDAFPGTAGVICSPHPPHDQGFRGRAFVDFLPTLQSLRGGPGASAWCFRRDALRRAGCFDVGFRRMQDYELLIRMVGQGYSVLRHDEQLYRYRPSIDRGHRYSHAQQLALERFAATYGAEDAATWLELRLDPGDRRAIRALMTARAMNVAALRGKSKEVRELARAAATNRMALPRSRQAQVALAALLPRTYCRVLKRRSSPIGGEPPRQGPPIEV